MACTPAPVHVHLLYKESDGTPKHKYVEGIDRVIFVRRYSRHVETGSTHKIGNLTPDIFPCVRIRVAAVVLILLPVAPCLHVTYTSHTHMCCTYTYTGQKLQLHDAYQATLREGDKSALPHNG